jgi:hypothetical protein
MSSAQTAEAVRNFLKENGDRAFLISEVVVAVQSLSGGEAEVLGVIDDLADKGEVFSRLFPVRDPHLAFTSLQFVAAVHPAGNSRRAEINTERAYQSWLRQWLSSHRCS